MIWKPHEGPQEDALRTAAFELLFGGARGPGKTDAGVVWIGCKPELIENPRYRALVIRRNADDLVDWIDRARLMYSRYKVQIVGRPYEIRFPSGAKIRTGHLRDANAYSKYQGHEYQRMLIEELTQIPQEKHYIQLIGSCRSTVDGIDARIFATTNPGGVGHAWVKRRFIDPSPPNTVFMGHDTERTRIFIPGRVEDNPTLLQKDPNYLRYLEGLKETDVELWKAWRLGDWDTFAGQYFREFRRDLHVLPYDYIPQADDIHIGGMDWGRADPFAFIGTVIRKIEWLNPETLNEHTFYRAITYKEVYGTEKRPEEWGEIIRTVVPLTKYRFIQADTQIYNPGNDKSMSIYEQFCQFDEEYRGRLRPASKERVGGWENMRKWLSIAPDGKPYWQINPSCTNLIRTLPELVHDENNVEDVDTTGEDHAEDAVRYMFKALRWIDGRARPVPHGTGQRVQAGPLIKRPVEALDTDAFK